MKTMNYKSQTLTVTFHSYIFTQCCKFSESEQFVMLMQYILTYLLSYDSFIWQNLLDSLVTKVAINQHFIEATSLHIVDKYDQIPNTFWKEPTSVEFDLTNGSISEHFLGNANWEQINWPLYKRMEKLKKRFKILLFQA